MVDFDWEGILPNGKEMTAKAVHSWLVRDDLTEAFARTKAMNVDVLMPCVMGPKLLPFGKIGPQLALS